MARSAFARSDRRSAGPTDDGTQGFSDALVDEGVVETLLGRGPIRAKSLGMHAHLIGDPEHFSGRVAGLEIVPGAGLRPGDDRPISSSELPERVAVHHHG